METQEDPFPIQNFYFFQSKERDTITAFEKASGFNVNRRDVYEIPISELEKDAKNPKTAPKSWWNSFWQDGWSHLTFGTVSTGIGVGVFWFATGPVGWITGVLAIGGGSASMFSGGVQLLSNDPEIRMVAHELGKASLSLNNIPGFSVGTATYLLTRDYEQSLWYADIAGLTSAGISLTHNVMKATKMQRLFNLEVGSNSTKWAAPVRNINASLMEINPKGLEGSHLVPQRILKTLGEKFPKFKRDIEKLGNGPLGINFLSPMEHALVDPYRFRTLTALQKEALAVTNPVQTSLIKNYPRIAELVGIPKNMSPTIRPVFNCLLITGGRIIKLDANSCEK